MKYYISHEVCSAQFFNRLQNPNRRDILEIDFDKSIDLIWLFIFVYISVWKFLALLFVTGGGGGIVEQVADGRIPHESSGGLNRSFSVCIA